MDDKPKRKVSWRNVAFLVLLGSPFLWIADHYMPHWGGPGLTSPEGRAIVRDFVAQTWPELFAGGSLR